MNGFLCKTFRILAICCCLCFLLGNIFSVAADDLQVVESSEVQDTFSYIPDPEDIKAVPDPVQDPIIINVNSSLEGDFVLVDEDTHITRVTASDTNGFKAVILGLFGDYEMITKEYTYQNVSSGYSSKQVTTESDYPWMISAAIFTIVLYCLFRLIGGVLCGRK